MRFSCLSTGYLSLGKLSVPGEAVCPVPRYCSPHFMDPALDPPLTCIRWHSEKGFSLAAGLCPDSQTGCYRVSFVLFLAGQILLFSLSPHPFLQTGRCLGSAFKAFELFSRPARLPPCCYPGSSPPTAIFHGAMGQGLLTVCPFYLCPLQSVLHTAARVVL